MGVIDRPATEQETSTSVLDGGTELSQAGYNWRRLRRPQSYLNAIRGLLDIKHWRDIDESVEAYAHERGDDFFVLQIGAHDGVRSDPLNRLINKHNWQGLLVEPVPAYFERLQANYRDHTLLQMARVAITNHDGEAVLHAVKPPSGSSRLEGCDSLDREAIKRTEWVTKNPSRLIKAMTVPAMRLQTLLDAYEVPHIDYFVIDAEGHDKIILDQLDFSRYSPKFILYEYNHLNSKDRRELVVRLRNQGYDLTTLKRDIFAQRAT